MARRPSPKIESAATRDSSATTEAASDAGAPEASAAHGNKSAAIRLYLESHPQAKNKDVIEQLRTQGHEVSTNYVSIIKSKLKSRRPAAKRGSKPGTKRSVAQQPPVDGQAAPTGYELIEAAAAFIQAAGGLKEAQQLLERLSIIGRM